MSCSIYLSNVQLDSRIKSYITCVTMRGGERPEVHGTKPCTPEDHGQGSASDEDLDSKTLSEGKKQMDKEWSCHIQNGKRGKAYAKRNMLAKK